MLGITNQGNTNQTSTRYETASARMASVKKTRGNKHHYRCGEKGPSCTAGAGSMEDSAEASRKTEVEPDVTDASSPLLGTQLKTETSALKRRLHLHLRCNITQYSQHVEIIQASMNE